MPPLSTRSLASCDYFDPGHSCADSRQITLALHSAVQPTPPNAPTTPEQFRRRLGYYLVGLAVGCVLLGMLQVFRSREAAAQRAAEAAAGAEPESRAAAPTNPR